MPLPDASLLDSLHYGLATWTPQGRLSYYNRGFRDYYFAASAFLRPDMSFEEFLGHLVEQGDVITTPDPSRWMAQQLEAFGVAGTREHQLADGRTIEVVQTVDQSGAVVMTVSDITGVRTAERALRHAKELAEAADQTKSRFLRAANHDLRQPLSTLKILIYNCLAEADASHRADLLHAMDISVAIMEDLLNALLQIGQLDAGKIVPRITTFQLSQVLGRLGVQFTHIAQEKGLDLRVMDTSLTVRSDRALLERILSNLISNAIRYTDTGRVLVGARRRGDRVTVQVWDTGCGISQAHQERIFDEFYQVGSVGGGRRKGLGLGLNIVKRLTELMDHRLSVCSIEGRGSVFEVELPLGNIWESELGEPVINEMVGGEFVGIVVYLIEDDSILSDAAKHLLERWGITVHTITTLEEALTLIDDQHVTPELIVADYRLKGIQGTEVVGQIRRRLGYRVPCIMMTADTDPKLIESIRQYGDPVLIKPVSPPRLRVLMHNLLYEPSESAPQ